MARALQQGSAFAAYLTEAKYARSRLEHIAAANVLPGDLLSEEGNLAAFAEIVRWVALTPAPVGRVGQITVLARNAEIVDSYLRYRTLNRVATAAQLAQYGIIVRPGIFESAVVSSVAFNDDEPPPAEAQILVPVSQPDGGAVGPLAGLRAWAIILTFRRWVVGFAVRWGRR